MSREHGEEKGEQEGKDPTPTPFSGLFVSRGTSLLCGGGRGAHNAALEARRMIRLAPYPY